MSSSAVRISRCSGAYLQRYRYLHHHWQWQCHWLWCKRLLGRITACPLAGGSRWLIYKVYKSISPFHIKKLDGYCIVLCGRCCQVFPGIAIPAHSSPCQMPCFTLHLPTPTITPIPMNGLRYQKLLTWSPGSIWKILTNIILSSLARKYWF